MSAEYRKKIVFSFVRMIEFSKSNVKYTYVHDQKYSSEVVDIHHIILRRSNAKYFFMYTTTLLVLACALYLYVYKVCLPSVLFFNDSRILNIVVFTFTSLHFFYQQEKTISLVYCSFLFDIFLVKSLLGKPIKKGEDLPSRVLYYERLTAIFILTWNGKYIHLHVLIFKLYFVIFTMFVILLAESVVIMPAFGVQLETHYVR